MDSDENLCSQGNLKRKAEAGRTCQLLRLLHGTSCFEVMLNRRMPNGMYGGVRGGLNSPYSIDGQEITELDWDNESTVENICLLSRLHAD